MSNKNKIAASVIFTLASVATVFRGYIFHIDWQTNLLLFCLSLITLSATWLFFRSLYGYLDKKIPYENGILRRLLLQIFITFAFANLLFRFVLFMATRFIVINEIVNEQFTNLALLAGISSEILLVILLNLAHFTEYSLQKWKESALRANNLEKEKSQVQFDNLKNQFNPHFLFNSLTSLDSLIQDNPKLAREFLQQLSKVFRYLLQSKEKGVVNLETELTFIQHYVALLETRFGKNLKINIDVKEADLDKKIVPATLQILIENAIKHNIIDKANTLTISILTFDNYVFVENNMLPKKQVETSNRQGLNNLKSLYSFLSETPLETSQNTDNSSNLFSVKVPLL